MDDFRVLKWSALKHFTVELKMRDHENRILNSFSLGTIRFSERRQVSGGTSYFS